MIKRCYKPLNMFYSQTDKLKKLIAEHPDYPIVVMVGYEVVGDDYGWWYAPEIRFSLGELLDCEQKINDEKTYIDRDDFEEDVRYFVECDDRFDNSTDEEIEAEVRRILLTYEPYWTKVIKIMADV